MQLLIYKYDLLLLLGFFLEGGKNFGQSNPPEF